MSLLKKIALLLLPILGAHAFAQDAHQHHHAAVSAPELMVSATAQTPLKENVATKVTLWLTDKNGAGVGEDQLKTVHTEKVHALIIDPTLTDYQHVHPNAGKKAGEYIFNFIPHTANNYRIWLDVTPINGTQQYVMTDLSGANTKNPAVIKKLGLTSEVDGYDFTLSFDKPLKVGQDVLGSIVVTDKQGHKVTTLEPIMEAFAHIVAFNEDYKTILHVHPMGVEPKNANLRGGPQIDFHLTPTQAGYVKIFAQVKINGKEIFAPFGVRVVN